MNYVHYFNSSQESLPEPEGTGHRGVRLDFGICGSSAVVLSSDGGLGGAISKIFGTTTDKLSTANTKATGN